MTRAAKVLALGALLLWGPGILLPALHVDKLGHRCESSILDGCVRLFAEGEMFIATVVGLSALVLPPLKIIGVLWLARSPPTGFAPPRWLARTLEIIGRFGCLEVFLTALLVTVEVPDKPGERVGQDHEFDLGEKATRN